MSDYSNDPVKPRPYVQPTGTVNQSPTTPVRSGTPGLGIALIVIAAFVVIAIMWATMSQNQPVLDPANDAAAPAAVAPATPDAAPAAPAVNDTVVDPAPADEVQPPVEGTSDPAPATPAPATPAPAP